MTEETETVKVTLELPKPVYNFYKALAETNNKTVENILTAELISNIETYLDIDSRMKNLIIYQYDLEKILE